ncbi:hypothetical protein ACET3Z_011047 [Daucus carota]
MDHFFSSSTSSYSAPQHPYHSSSAHSQSENTGNGNASAEPIYISDEEVLLASSATLTNHQQNLILDLPENCDGGINSQVMRTLILHLSFLMTV